MWWSLPVAVRAVVTGVSDSAGSSHQLIYLDLCRDEDTPPQLPIYTEEERESFPMTEVLLQTSWPAVAVSKDLSDSKDTKLLKCFHLQEVDQYQDFQNSLSELFSIR